MLLSHFKLCCCCCFWFLLLLLGVPAFEIMLPLIMTTIIIHDDTHEVMIMTSFVLWCTPPNDTRFPLLATECTPLDSRVYTFECIPLDVYL